MQLVPLSTDGRISVALTAPLPAGPLRVALRVSAENVVIEALGPVGPRPVACLAPPDATAYRPVLTRLAARGQIGACPALMIHTAEAATLVLHLGAPATCVPSDAHRIRLHAGARTTRLPASVPVARAAQPHRPCPSTLPRPREARAPETRTPAGLPRRRSARPAVRPRPPARFGQPDDAAPRLTRDQRRRVLWATAAVAAALLLASLLQQGGRPATTGAAACAESAPTCRSAQP